MAAELLASASGEGGATSARGHEASEQKFIAEVENEKHIHWRQKLIAEKRRALRSQKFIAVAEKGCVEEKDKSKIQRRSDDIKEKNRRKQDDEGVKGSET